MRHTAGLCFSRVRASASAFGRPHLDEAAMGGPRRRVLDKSELPSGLHCATGSRARRPDSPNQKLLVPVRQALLCLGYFPTVAPFGRPSPKELFSVFEGPKVQT